ncbi:MAG: alpha/beta fold hydrolase [Chloroflexi bacterium]|nr:alpha/beta fold hydrolase [Chloroflexota bacterium]
MPKIHANGIEFYYEWHGPENAEVLILSNGILMSTASWAFQTSAFAKQYRVLLYDCRGQWQSDHPREPYSMEQHADDLAALLDALGVARAHIGGVSYGAEISLIFAYRYPQKTANLIVAATVSEIDAVLRGIGEMWLDAAKRHDPDLFFRVTYPFNFSARWIADNAPALEQARARYARLDFDAVVNLTQAFLNLNITLELHRITAPTLLIVGEDDGLKPRRYADKIAVEIPHAEYAIIPRAGHSVMWEQAQTFNSLVLGFLSQHRE